MLQGVSIVTSFLVPPDEVFAISTRTNPDGSKTVSAAKVKDIGSRGLEPTAIFIDEWAG